MLRQLAAEASSSDNSRLSNHHHHPHPQSRFCAVWSKLNILSSITQRSYPSLFRCSPIPKACNMRSYLNSGFPRLLNHYHHYHPQSRFCACDRNWMNLVDIAKYIALHCFVAWLSYQYHHQSQSRFCALQYRVIETVSTQFILLEILPFTVSFHVQPNPESLRHEELSR